MEHRCGYRRALNAEVIIRTRGGLVGKAVLCEVSASGARVTSSLPLALHSVVLVQFRVRRLEGSLERATIEAEVVRWTETGFAVEWVEFAPEAARALYAPPIADARAPLQTKRRRTRQQ